MIILIDGGFFKPKFRRAFSKTPITAKKVDEFVKSTSLKFNGDLPPFRVYWYDCPPLDYEVPLPISQKPFHFKSTPTFLENTTLLKELKRTDFFSVREGKLSFRGFIPKDRKGINKCTQDDDFKQDIQQKGVDIKIGLDLAWISYQKIDSKVLIVTGDSDFIPALKLARRNGIQVYLLTLGHGVTDELKDHADVLNTDPITVFINP